MSLMVLLVSVSLIVRVIGVACVVLALCVWLSAVPWSLRRRYAMALLFVALLLIGASVQAEPKREDIFLAYDCGSSYWWDYWCWGPRIRELF